MLITLGNHVNERTVNLNNCGPNQEVTFELDGQIYTSVTSDESGLAIAKLYDDGIYTVRTEFKTQSKTLIVDDDTENYDFYFRYYLLDYGNRYINFGFDGGPPGGTYSVGYVSNGVMAAAYTWTAYASFSCGSVDITPYKTVVLGVGAQRDQYWEPIPTISCAGHSAGITASSQEIRWDVTNVTSASCLGSVRVNSRDEVPGAGITLYYLYFET